MNYQINNLVLLCREFFNIIMSATKVNYATKGKWFGIVFLFVLLFILLLVWVYNMNSQLDF
jgi:hypothetical protein